MPSERPPAKAPSAHCAMVGPHPREQGGVSSVVASLEAAGLFAGDACTRLDSFVAGGLGAKALTALTALTRLLLLLLRGQAQVVHVHVSSRASFWRKALFIWLARLAGRRVVFHLHGGGFQAFYKGLAPPLANLAALTLKQCDQLLCLSSPVQRWLAQVAPGVPAQWWPNPVAVVDGVAMASDAEADALVFLGALTEDKGVDALLRAFATLRAQAPQAQLLIGGEGPDRARLEALASALTLGSSCRFVGWVRGGEKAELLRRARLLVLPSRMESQPVVLLEAMAAQVPVLATAVGGVPDLVSHGSSGWLVPAGDDTALAQAMMALWKDRPLRVSLAAAAVKYVRETHAAHLVVSRHLTLYRSLVSGVRS